MRVLRKHSDSFGAQVSPTEGHASTLHHFGYPVCSPLPVLVECRTFTTGIVAAMLRSWRKVG